MRILHLIGGVTQYKSGRSIGGPAVGYDHMIRKWRFITVNEAHVRCAYLPNQFQGILLPRWERKHLSLLQCSCLPILN